MKSSARQLKDGGSPLKHEPKAPISGSLSPLPETMRGAGDLVEKFAQPIARTLDKVLGTNIQGCGGCKKRKEKLNEMLPFK